MSHLLPGDPVNTPEGYGWVAQTWTDHGMGEHDEAWHHDLPGAPPITVYTVRLASGALVDFTGGQIEALPACGVCDP